MKILTAFLILFTVISVSCSEKEERYNEAERMKIYDDLVEVQNENEVLKKYELTAKELTAIRDEALAEGWPLPKEMRNNRKQ